MEYMYIHVYIYIYTYIEAAGSSRKKAKKDACQVIALEDEADQQSEQAAVTPQKPEAKLQKKETAKKRSKKDDTVAKKDDTVAKKDDTVAKEETEDMAKNAVAEKGDTVAKNAVAQKDDAVAQKDDAVAQKDDEKETPAKRCRQPQVKIDLPQCRQILELHLDDHSTFGIGAYVLVLYYVLRIFNDSSLSWNSSFEFANASLMFSFMVCAHACFAQGLKETPNTSIDINIILDWNRSLKGLVEVARKGCVSSKCLSKGFAAILKDKPAANPYVVRRPRLTFVLLNDACICV